MQNLNDNLTSVMLAGQPSHQSYHLQNSILIYWSYGKDPCCILLFLVMPVDAAQKKYENRLIESWILGVLFQKVLPAGHNAGPVIIKGVFCNFRKYYLRTTIKHTWNDETQIKWRTDETAKYWRNYKYWWNNKTTDEMTKHRWHDETSQ